MKLGVIADDFTGASDIALTLAEGGMPTVQYVGIPREAAGDRVAAGVVSLKSRTIPATDAVSQSLEACDWLLAQGCSQIIYKVCSTFDSTDEGNIGPVTAALAEKMSEDVVIVCPAFPENGRSVYQGHLFVKDRLLNESGMQNHPLTPMRDPDLRRVLGRQTDWPVSHMPIGTVIAGADAIRIDLQASGRTMAVIDAIQDRDLVEIGRAARERRLLTGGSGIALGLPENFGFSAGHSEWCGATGPGVVLSGSCSIATRQQVARYREKAPARELLASDVMARLVSVTELADWAVAQSGPPLIYSSADPDVVAEAQQAYGRETVADAFETLFADLSTALADVGVRRLVVAGGETSGAAVSGLDADVLEIGPKIAAGVPALKVSNRPLALALKSGNFGDADFFSTALDRLGAAA